MARSDEEDQLGDAGIDLVVFDRRFVADGVVEWTLRRPAPVRWHGAPVLSARRSE
jgi:hypothetical protein